MVGEPVGVLLRDLNSSHKVPLTGQQNGDVAGLIDGVMDGVSDGEIHGLEVRVMDVASNGELPGLVDGDLVGSPRVKVVASVAGPVGSCPVGYIEGVVVGLQVGARG